MNSERLADLQRQRAIVREHLAWLDREIATAARDAGSESTSIDGIPLAGAAPFFSKATPSPLGRAEPLLGAPTHSASPYQPDPVAAAAQTKRGCLLAVACMLLLGLAGLAAIYFVRYRDRPLFFAEKPATAEPVQVTPAKPSQPRK